MEIGTQQQKSVTTNRYIFLCIPEKTNSLLIFYCLHVSPGKYLDYTFLFCWYFCNETQKTKIKHFNKNLQRFTFF